MKDNAVASVGLGKQRHANPITKTSLPNRTTYHIGNSNIAMLWESPSHSQEAPDACSGGQEARR
jgi:hypothetical protein